MHNPRRSATAEVVIKVLDENDFVPQFLQMRYRSQLKENAEENVAVRVAKVEAYDEDLGPNAELRFSIPTTFNSLFTVNATSGVVTTATR